MEKPIDYISSSLYRRTWDGISGPTFDFGQGPMKVPKYYNRGRWRFVYRLADNRVLKIMKGMAPIDDYAGRFYKRALSDRTDRKDIPEANSIVEKFSLRTSLALDKVERDAYSDVCAIIPDRITETEYGIGKKVRLGVPFFRPYSIQPFVIGIPLRSLITGKKIIRDKKLNYSEFSTFGNILDFNRVDKAEVMEGIEDFLQVFERMYDEQDAVLDFGLHNLVFSEDGLICHDIQKFHKRDIDRTVEDHGASPLDTYYELAGVLEVNQ